MALTALRAIDCFTSDGSFYRTLYFRDENGKTKVMHFRDDRMSIIRGPREVYDWYGRLINLGPEIDEVIRHYGYLFDRNNMSKTTETFIVKKKNGKFSQAKLDKIPDTHMMCTMPTNKIILTGGYIGSISELECFGREAETDDF